jgi:hypothetical protein
MTKETNETREIMLPDDTVLEVGHKPFRKLTLTAPAVGGPIVKPPMVIVTTAAALIKAPEVVIATAVADVAPQVAVKPATLLPPTDTTGVMDGAKKESGYVSVMVPPAGTAFKGMNPSVAGTAAFPAFRSVEAMEKAKSML